MTQMTRPRATFPRPTPGQRLLLRAALGDDRRAAEAWRTWLATHNLDDIEVGSLFLVPRLCLNLGRLDPGAAELGRLRGIYRHTWARNQRALHDLAGLLARFDAAGVPVALLKGVPLLLSCYRDPGARAMHDVDLWVRPENRGRAVDVLISAGWTNREQPLPDELTPFVSAESFGRPRHVEIDLHWRPLLPQAAPEADGRMWHRLRPIEVQGQAALAPDLVDTLLLVLVHASKGDLQGVCRWRADVAQVAAAAGGTIDWNELARRAAEHRLTTLVVAALVSVREQLPQLVTDQVLAAFGADGVCTRWESSLRETSWTGPGRVIDRLGLHWRQYAAGCDSRGRLPNPAGFAWYAVRYSQWKWPHRRAWLSPLRLSWHVTRLIASRA
jgi:hypothetical protein